MKQLEVSQVLLCNPNDSEYEFSHEGMNSTLHSELFVQLPEYSRTAKELKGWISGGEKHQSIVILSGYSGCGKSTFLSWFKLRYSNKSSYFKILNLISKPLKGADINLIQYTVYRENTKFIYKNKSIKTVLENPEIFYEYFKVRVSKFSKSKPWEELKKLNTLISTLSENDIIGAEDIAESLYNNLTFRQSLFLYLFEIILRGKELEFDTISVCFDNLDELEFEYLTEKVWNDFIEVRSWLMEGCKLPEVDFSFNSKFSLLLVFREANLLVNSSQNRDRRVPKITVSKFVFNSTARRIIQQRLNFCRKYIPLKAKTSKSFKIASIVASDTYSDRIYLPMFNYDYRKILQAIVDIGTKDLLYNSNSITPNWYSKVKRHSASGHRGALASLFFKYLEDRGFLNDLAPRPRDTEINELGYCRVPRVLLTIIYRFSYENGVPFDLDLRNRLTPRKVKLSEVFNEYYKLFKDIHEFFSWIKVFFKIDSASWAHLVSLHGKQLSNGALKFKKEQESYEDYFVKFGGNARSDFEEINRDLFIHLNASGYVYLRYIIIHFEYFSILNCKRIGKRHVPLFLSFQIEKRTKHYVFKSLLLDVYKEIKMFKLNLEKYMLKSLKWNKDDLSGFRNSSICFKTDYESKPTYYFPRVISFHINYIDQFRYYILSTNKVFKPGKELKTIEDVNEFLINMIIEYCKLILHNNISYSTYPLIKSISERAYKALNKTKKEWFFINYDPKEKIKNYG